MLWLAARTGQGSVLSGPMRGQSKPRIYREIKKNCFTPHDAMWQKDVIYKISLVKWRSIYCYYPFSCIIMIIEIRSVLHACRASSLVRVLNLGTSYLKKINRSRYLSLHGIFTPMRKQIKLLRSCGIYPCSRKAAINSICTHSKMYFFRLTYIL